MFKVRAWDYPALLLTYERAVKVCRDRHVPVLIHVEECTQPQGHSTSGSHERYKTPERLAWAEEFDGLRQLGRFLVMEGAATEEELDRIRAEAKKTVRAEQKAAWQAVRQSLDRERDTAVELLRAVPVVQIGRKPSPRSRTRFAVMFMWPCVKRCMRRRVPHRLSVRPSSSGWASSRSVAPASLVGDSTWRGR